MSTTLFVTALHFSLCTLHFSLPAGTTFHSSPCTFHFPQGLLFTLHSSLLTSRRDHFSLCTLHFSLPEGTAFHFPQGLLLTSRRDHGAIADAARCVGTCTALRFPGERSPFLYKAASVGKHNIPPQPFHPAAGPGKARPQVQLCALHFPAAYSPCPASAPLRKEQKRSCQTRKQAVRTSPGTSAPPGAIV